MKNRAVRVALFLLVLAAFAGAGYELAMLDRQAVARAEAVRAFDEKAQRLDTALRELRAAEFAYVAAGQGSTFWTTRADALLSAIAQQLGDLAGLEKAATADGLEPATPVTTALDDLATLQRIDASVRGYLQQDQRLLASDLVFNDLREAGQALAVHVREARRQVDAAGDAAVEPLRRKQVATTGGAALFAVLVLALLLPAGGRDSAAAPGATASVLPAQPSTEPLRPSPAQAESSAGKAAPHVAQSERPLAPPPPASPQVTIDLPGAARLCTDLARVREPAELAALLERAATLLSANGVVIWVHHPGSGELRPALTFGYPPQALARIRPIAGSDDNATAGAYRERRLRVVKAVGPTNGAIAAPLATADGCAGVMAAEIRGGREGDASVQALATILAAQLATLVAPAPEGL